MKLYFSIYRQQGNWIAVQHTDSINYESQMHYSIKTKEDAINDLMELHPGDEVYVDGIPARDYMRLHVDKKAFRAIVQDNNNDYGKMIEIGNISLLGGHICKGHEDLGFYVGEDADRKTVDYLWRHVRKNGGFIYDNEQYYI